MKISFLCSYAYDKSLRYYLENIECLDKTHLIIDSGAFSAFHSGVDIKLNDYLSFIENKIIPKVKNFEAIQLDVLGNPKETRKNLLFAKKSGFNLMPVFTCGEEYEAIEELYTFHDYICVGNLKRLNPQRFIQHICSLSKGRKMHLLGYGKDKYIKMFKPYSFDTSGINDSVRFGRVKYYDDKRKILVETNKEELYKQTSHLSFVTSKNRYYNSIMHINDNNFNLNSALFSQFYAYVMQMIDYYYLHNVRSYISISSWEKAFSFYINQMFEVKEIKEKLAYYEEQEKKGTLCL